ncbi:MAG TPA: helix-turn-helix transcriptional regulator [bacterium]
MAARNAEGAETDTAKAEEELIKKGLVRRIALDIQELGWTQREAAECLEVDQPKVSALLNGNLAGFTVSRLMRFLAALGHDVDVTVKPRDRRQKKRGHIAVISD